MSLYNYALALEYADIVHAFVLTENNGVEPILMNEMGDAGQAIGIVQFHPADFAVYYGRSLRFPRSVKHTWAEAEIVACASFWDTEQWLDVDLRVQAWNLGVQGVKDGERNPDYLQRWTMNMNRIRGKGA